MCSVQMQENADQNNSEYGHFLHKDIFKQANQIYDLTLKLP